jgi:hypothetical protein
MTNIQNLAAPTTGNALRVELGNNTTATVARVKAAYGNKREAMYSVYIERNGERLFQTNRRGAGAWKCIKDDLKMYSA